MQFLVLLSLLLMLRSADGLSNFRCLLFKEKCLSHCPRGTHAYHTRCDRDTLSQRTCTFPYVYNLGSETWHYTPLIVQAIEKFEGIGREHFGARTLGKVSQEMQIHLQPREPTDSSEVLRAGYTCGWSRCDCNGDKVLDEETWTCVALEECEVIRNRRRISKKMQLPKKLRLKEDDEEMVPNM